MPSSFPSRLTSERLAIALAVALAPGCVSPSAERRFDEPASAVLPATLRALHGWHDLVRVHDGRLIETGWFEIDPGTSEGILFERPDEGRARLAAEVEPDGPGSRVAIFVRAEKRKAAGARAYRFERMKPPEGLAREAMEAIAREVAGEGAR